MKTSKLPPIHPGEILREEFMKPRGLSQNAMARALNVPPRRINEIVLEQRAITADTALRLARYFGTPIAGISQRFFMRVISTIGGKHFQHFQLFSCGCVAALLCE